MPEKLSKLNQSVEKVIQIIETMYRQGTPMRLQDIARKTSMPASTALRMVNTLLVYGYMDQDPVTLRYSLSLKFARIGDAVSSRFNLGQTAHPLLVELSRRCGESCCFGIESLREVLYTDVVDGPDNMLCVMQRIGKRAPLHSTGIGKLLLLNYSREELHLLAEEKGLTRLTPNTLTTEEALAEQLELIRARGYALDDEECELGARCIAAPVRDHRGLVVGGVSISGPVTRLNHKRIDELIPVVEDTAAQLSRLMAYPGQNNG